jgi:hypothetical protein
MDTCGYGESSLEKRTKMMMEKTEAERGSGLQASLPILITISES